MSDRDLADRLVNYADAVAALAFVGVSGLGIGVADPDIRCTLAGAKPTALLSNLLSGALFSTALVVLRRWELDLRSGDAGSPKGQRYARFLHGARLLVVWASVAMVALLVAGIDREGCGPG